MFFNTLKPLIFRCHKIKHLRALDINRFLSKTIDKQEVEQFEKFGSEWWNEYGPMKALHSLNKLRIPFIRDGLVNVGTVKNINGSTPLLGVKILDVGCGGGILSEPLSRLGASVDGLDANSNIIELAKTRASKYNLNINYYSNSIENHCEQNQEKYDAVVASEVLEHVTNQDEFIKKCVKCLKPEGSIFLTTINQTNLAKFAVILLGENVFELLPKGTHHYEKFIAPHKLQRILEDENCKTTLIHGIYYNLCKNEWYWCKDDSISYALHAVKLQKTDKK